MQSKASRRYSLALYGVAEDKDNMSEIAADINFVLDLINSNHDLELFFASPVVPKNKKLEIIKNIFTGKVSEVLISFMNLLAQRGRSNLTKEIFNDFIKLKKERGGIVDVHIKTSVTLNEDEKANMKKKIDSYTNLKSDLHFEIDKTIIGGFVAKIDDTILDASIKRQLELLKDKFKKGDYILN